MVEILLDGFGIPDEWALSIMLPIFNAKGDIRNCNCNRAAKLFEDKLKVVEEELEK